MRNRYRRIECAIFCLLLFLLSMSFAGCAKAEKQAEAEKVSDPPEAAVIDAPEKVQELAQDEIDRLIHMLSVDGFFADDTQTGGLVTMPIRESKITGLSLERSLEFFDHTTIDLYRLDFALLPENPSELYGFTLNSDGFIASDTNFTFAEADGTEADEGQLYLLVDNSGEDLTSMGIRRAASFSDAWCEKLLAYYNYPPGAGRHFSAEEIQSIRAYWEWQAEWSFTMPCENGYGDEWHVGLGDAYECGLGIPYPFIGSASENAQDMVALSFTTVNRVYYDGLRILSFSGFYGDDPDGPGYSVNDYISCTQPDCETSRGIHPGDTVSALCAVYPEVYEEEGYNPGDDEETGIAVHDRCFIYAPEGSNRSILFLTKNDQIVQIDMADGLDGQYTTPRGV